MGMKERSDYLTTKVRDDKFIALDKKNTLSTWSTLSGKTVMQWNLCDSSNPSDYSGYEIYKYENGHEVFEREWYSKTLLISKNPI